MPKVTVPRKKSCFECSAAKARCSLSLPKCDRCETKKLTCSYENPPARQSIRQNARLGIHAIQEETLQPRELSPQIPIDVPLVPSGDFIEQTSLARLSTPDPFTDMNPALEWDLSYLPDLEMDPPSQICDLIIEGEVHQSAGHVTAPQRDPSPKSPDLQPTMGHFPRFTNDLPWPSSFDEVGNPRPPTIQELSSYHNKSLVTSERPQLSLLSQAKQATVGSWLTAKTMKGIMISFLRQLVDDEVRLPPFIYPMFSDRDQCQHVCKYLKPKEHLHEPLAVCVSIVQMCSNKSTAHRSFVCRTIDQEQQKIRTDSGTYDRWMTLSALQACTIYLALLAIEEDNNEKKETVHAQQVACSVLPTIAELMMQIHNHGYLHDKQPTRIMDQHSPPSPFTWRDWVWEESVRRIIALIYILGLITNLPVGKSSHAACLGFDHVPLPAPKALWESQTAQDWETRYTEWASASSHKKTLTVGMLRKVRSVRMESEGSELMEDLGRWCDGLDRFGEFVVLAVSMIPTS